MAALADTPNPKAIQIPFALMLVPPKAKFDCSKVRFTGMVIGCVLSPEEGVSTETGKFPGADEDVGEHWAVEAAGVRVAQRWVIAAEQAQAVWKRVFRAMAEAVVRPASDDACKQEMGEETVPGDLTQADDDADAGQRVDLGRQMHSAVADLLRRGLVAGRRAANDGGDPGMTQAEAVVAGDGSGLGSESKLVEHRIHKVS